MFGLPHLVGSRPLKRSEDNTSYILECGHYDNDIHNLSDAIKQTGAMKQFFTIIIVAAVHAHAHCYCTWWWWLIPDTVV